MVIKIGKGFRAFIAVVFAAALFAVAAFCLTFAGNQAWAEEIADEVAVASVSFGDKTTTHSNMESAFNKANEYASGESDPAVITLLRDRLTNTSSKLTVDAGKFVTLDLNGRKLHFQGVNTGNSPITVNGTFTLTDRQPNVEHRYNIAENGLYEFTEDGAYTLKGGVITGGYNKDTAIRGGGCIYVSGKFIMQSGTIAGNQTTYNGGGVYGYNATFEMRGGMIAGNSSGAESGHHGGGVYSTGSNASFTMSGGIIKDNRSGNNGGGVYINGGKFNLNGGEITGNTAANSKNGGGVYVCRGTLNISGTPVVTGNAVDGKDNNLFIEIGSIAVSGELETTTPAASAQIGLTLKNNGVNFTGYYNENNKTSELSKYFTFDSGNCASFDVSGSCTAGSAHTPDNAYKADGLGHWNECGACKAKVNYAAHSGNAASCTAAGKCDVCNENYGPNGHKFVRHAAVAATCTAQGYKEYWYCSVCDKNYADGEKFSVNLLTGVLTTPVDSGNHNFDTEWTADGAEGHYHACLNGCAAKGDSTAHTFDAADGTCSVCGYASAGVQHEFAEIADGEFLASEATCSQKAVYFKSCKKCGAKGTETFEYGDYGAHNVTSINIATQPVKKSYTAFDTFDTAGMEVKTHCSNCNKDSEAVTDYAVVYASADELLHVGDESVDIEYGNMTAAVGGLTVAKKEAQVTWQYIENAAWGEWKSQFVYNPYVADVALHVRATLNGGKDEYRGTNKLVIIKKDGAELSAEEDVNDAGVYTFALDESAAEFADYKLTGNSAELTVTKLTIELSSKTESTDFYWLLADYDSALLSGYVDAEFRYSSAAGADGKYAEYSIVRNRNGQVGIKLFGAHSTDNLGVRDGVYTIAYESGNTGEALGEYTAKAVLTLVNGNYEFSVGAFGADRRMTAQLQNDGSVLVTKTWYIAQVDNGLLSQDKDNGTYGKDWDISDWTYGAYVPQKAPRLEHGDAGDYGGVKTFAGDDNLVTFRLVREETVAAGVNRVQIGVVFNRSEFNNYINGSVPAGSYVLAVRVGKYTSTADEQLHVHWYDGTAHVGQVTGVVYDAFEVEYRFKVAKAQFGQTNLNELENKTFRYVYDGELHFYDGTFAPEASVRSVRTGIWSDAAYNGYYGKAHLHYNLGRWNTAAFLDPQEIADFVDETQKPQGAGTYRVYYEMYAPNYADLGGDKYFTVIISKMGIGKPADMTESYSGSAVTYAVAENALYRVTGKASYTDAGSYGITLTLKNSDNYAWKDADGTLSPSNTATVKMIITKARITVPAARTEQLNGKYVYEVSEGALYTLEGNAEFTEAGDYDITLKLKDSVNYEWKTAEGEALEGATATVKLHLGTGAVSPTEPTENGGAGAPDVWLILSIITAVVIAGEIAYIAYRLLRKNKNTEGEE